MTFQLMKKKKTKNKIHTPKCFWGWGVLVCGGDGRVQSVQLSTTAQRRKEPSEENKESEAAAVPFPKGTKLLPERERENMNGATDKPYHHH